MDKLHFITDEIRGKKVLVLGFGREGQSTCQFLQDVLPEQDFIIADNDANLPLKFEQLRSNPHIGWQCGNDYMQSVYYADVIVKSPGIPLKNIPGIAIEKITSQTEWFLRAFRRQVCGITGTKGKSTTSSLLNHLLKQGKYNSLLVGNIGIPPLSALNEISDHTHIVFELSCHQLQGLNISPSASILLNIFQEHLDHYKSLEEYQLTKLNIGLHQEKEDILIIHAGDETTHKYLGNTILKGSLYQYALHKKTGVDVFIDKGNIIFNYENNDITLATDIHKIPLQGDHNLLNVMAASTLAFLKGVDPKDIHEGVHTFQPLEHRLEDVGLYRGIRFYNDSISTTPESSVQALKTLKNVETLIIGGFDRNIDYSVLTDYLIHSRLKTLIITGTAGRRIRDELDRTVKLNFVIIEAFNYEQVIELAINKTTPGKICLLSPAAASYDWFKDFEERGTTFKNLVRKS